MVLHRCTPAAEEFEERAKQIEHEEQERLDNALPAAQPVGLLESAGCEHLREATTVCLLLRGDPPGGGGSGFVPFQ